MAIVWDEENAAHLLRRAGFAARPEAVAKAVKKGQQKTVAGLFPKKKPKDAPQKGALDSLATLQTWWVRRMVTAKQPLIEKLTLFWHDHFATGISKIENTLYMHEQNRLLRARALGPFRDMVLDVSRDVAMLIWLDNQSNKKADPNENYARELMELFTTGVLDAAGQHNYTEQDVVEAARAFTGWSTQWKDGRLHYQFKEWHHDYGTKTFRGISGPLDGGDVVENLVLDPATPRRLAMKLYSYFAREVELDDPLLDPLVDAYFAADTRIEPMLRALFLSDGFYAAECKNALVKSPAEYVANALILLKAKLDPKDPYELGQLPGRLGQELFDPPSVFGWDEGLPWVQTGGMLDRARVAQDLAAARDKSEPIRVDPLHLLGPKKQWSKFGAAETVDRVLSRLGPVSVAASTRAALITYVESDAVARNEPFVLDEPTVDRKVRGLIALVLASPEFQVH